MTTLIEEVVDFVVTLIEVTLKAFRNFFVVSWALVSRRRREQLRKEWHGGAKPRVWLILSATYGALMIFSALYFWIRILA